jgi:small subunit ribosomal protein S9
VVSEKRYYATGKRKTAVARVWIKPGAGRYTINGREFENYFPLQELRLMVNKPFVITENTDKFDVVANIYGGGIAAQAWALGHGIAKALLEFNSGLRVTLKKQGLITRDPRVKERKKYGKKAARASFQFSKR